MILATPTILSSQYTKQWELYKPTNRTVRSSYNINSNNHLKTIQLKNGTFVTLGSQKKVSSEFGDEIFIFNFDAYGNTVWEYSYLSTNEINEYPYDIATDEDDNIYIAARTTTYYEKGFEFNIEHSNPLIIKLNSIGQLQWDNVINAEVESVNYSASVIVDEDSNVYTFSRIGGSSILQKINTSGDEIWRTYINQLEPYSLEINTDEIVCTTKNYSVFGQSYTYFIDSNGIKKDSFYITKLGGNKPKFDSSGNSYKFQFDLDGDYKLEKRNRHGNIKWTYLKESNLPSNVIADELIDCTFDDLGNVYVTGRYYGKHYADTLLYSNCDILTSKIDSAGNVLWENIYKYDNTPFSCQIGNAIKVRNGSNLYVSGSQSVEENGNVFSSSDIVVLKYNQEGERVDSIYFNSVYNKQDFSINIELVEEDLYVFGYSENLDQTYDMTIVKYARSTSSSLDQPVNDNILVYPNPTSRVLNFLNGTDTYNIELWSLKGELVFLKEAHDIRNSLELPTTIMNGIYLIRLKNDKESTIIKVLKNDH